MFISYFKFSVNILFWLKLINWQNRYLRLDVSVCCLHVNENDRVNQRVMRKTLTTQQCLHKMSATYNWDKKLPLTSKKHVKVFMLSLRNMRTHYLDLVDNAIYIMMCKIGGRNHLNTTCILTSSYVYKLFFASFYMRSYFICPTGILK